MTVISIHQPEYLPWINLFNKIEKSDIFIFLDNVQYNRRSFQNRNLIKSMYGPEYLTVPIKKQSRDTQIKDILINNNTNWRLKHLNKINTNYKNANYFDNIFHKLNKIIQADFEYLSDLNIALIKLISDILKIKVIFYKTSNFKFSKKKSNLILEICNHFEANHYIAGDGSRNYLKIEDFKSNKIEVEYIPPLKIKYKQQHENLGFIKDLSVVDIIFNEKKKFI